MGEAVAAAGAIVRGVPFEAFAVVVPFKGFIKHAFHCDSPPGR